MVGAITAADGRLEPEDFLQKESLQGYLSPAGRWAIVTSTGGGKMAQSVRANVELFDTAHPDKPVPLSDNYPGAMFAAWSPDETHVALLVGRSGAFRVEVVACGSGAGVWSSEVFSNATRARPFLHWISATRFVLQAQRLGDADFARFAVSEGAAERLQGWAAKLRGEDSAIAIDTRQPVGEELAVDVWLGDIGAKTLTSFFRAPPLVAITFSPDRNCIGLIAPNDWSRADATHEDLARPRAHRLDFFSVAGAPKAIGRVDDLFFRTGYGYSDAAAWRNSSEVWCAVQRDGKSSWLQFRFANGKADSELAPIPEKIGQPRWWFFANERLLVQGEQGKQSRWWCIQPNGEATPLHDLVSGLAADPIDVVPVPAQGGEPVVLAISSETADVVGFGNAPKILRSAKLPFPVIAAYQHTQVGVGKAVAPGAAVVLTGEKVADALAFDPASGGIRPLFRAGEAFIMGVSPSGVVLERVTKPGSVAFFLRSPERRVELRATHSDRRNLSEPVRKVLTYQPDRRTGGTTDDNKPADLLLFLPQGSEQPRPLPTVVFLYLGNTRENWETVVRASDQLQQPLLFTSHDYACLIPIMPFRRGRDAGDSIDALTECALPAIAEAVRSGWVDRNRIAFLGGSFGGLNVLQLLTRTDIAKAAISHAGSFNLMAEWGDFVPSDTLAAAANATVSQNTITEGGQVGMRGPPWEATEQYLHNSPDVHVNNIHTPVLLLKGDQDYVSQNAASYTYTALKRVGVPVRLVMFRGEGHVIGSPGNLARAAREILDWLDTYIGEKRGGRL